MEEVTTHGCARSSTAREARARAGTKSAPRPGSSSARTPTFTRPSVVVVVSMEMPGVDKSSIDIRLDKGVLTVKGTIDSREVRVAAADLLRVQRRQLRPHVHRVDEDRRRADLGQRGRRRADGRAAEGRGSPREAHLGQLTDVPGFAAAKPGLVTTSAKASSTLPGVPTMPPLPAVTYSIPPATTGPGPVDRAAVRFDAVDGREVAVRVEASRAPRRRRSRTRASRRRRRPRTRRPESTSAPPIARRCSLDRPRTRAVCGGVNHTR